jgi:hypothetical protein
VLAKEPAVPIYRSIGASKESERRIAEGLLKLKGAFEKAGIPERNLSSTLLLATWNIREFDTPPRYPNT